MWKRAGDVIARIRALATKTATGKERLNMNEAVREVVAFAQDEVRRNRLHCGPSWRMTSHRCWATECSFSRWS
jgi:hypothetical protein